MYPPVTELVLHRPPMLLIDAVLRADERSASCVGVLRAGSLFVTNGHAHTVVLVEYMAQAIAAFAGLEARAKGDAIEPGYLVGSREIVFDIAELSVGDEIHVDVVKIWGDAVLGSFVCEARVGAAGGARGTLNVYRGAIPASVSP